MKVLVSSLAHSSRIGSEAVVGLHVVESLASRFETLLVTSAGMERGCSDKCRTVNVKFDDPNDVSEWQLLLFELRQRRLVRRLSKAESFEVVHRATPSGVKPSLMRPPNVPLVLGPILLSKRYPPGFEVVFSPRIQPRKSLAALMHRVKHGVARRVFLRISTLQQLFDRAALILVGSQTTMDQLPAVCHDRCRAITFAGVEHDLFRPAAVKPANRTPQLLFVGRIVAYKGVELLLRATAAASRVRPLKLKIIGGGYGDYRRYCMALSQQLGLGGVVKWCEPQSRESLISEYQSADVYCMPSIETYGISILEAMSCGCAVVASDINGPGDIVQPGTGVKVPLENPDQFINDFAGKIVELIDDEAQRRTLGEAAREHVVRHHDWKNIKSQLLHYYDEFLAQTPMGAACGPKRARSQ